MSESGTSIPNIRALLAKHGLYAKKNYGQNFLVDTHVLNKIISASDVCSDDFVIEIGAGLGSLTIELSKKAKKVIAYEIDTELLPVLEETLNGIDNVEIINQDFLKADLVELLKEHGETTCKVVANLPYYITTPIIFMILENNLPVSSLTIMVQKEVGERMRASPSTKSYGALTLNIGYYCDVSLVANVPSNCFVPRPDIDSAVMLLKVYSRPQVDVSDSDLLFSIIKAAFSKRRKTLVNGLSSFDGLAISKEIALNAIINSGFSENVRGETLGLMEFAKLTEEIHKLQEKQ